MISKHHHDIIRLFGGMIGIMNLVIGLIFLAKTCGEATYGLNTLNNQFYGLHTFDGKNKIIDALKVYRGIYSLFIYHLNIIKT